jgi:hypothetical protein
VPSLTPVAWGFVGLVVVLALSLIYWRLVRQRDDALAQASEAHILTTQVLARAVFLRLAGIDHHAAYVHDLCQDFGVTDWILHRALHGLAVDGMVHEVTVGQHNWVELTLRGKQTAGL